MNRRRALMAAVSQNPSDNPWEDLPPESTEFGFPLYLNLTEYDANMDEWYRTEDSISTALYEWCKQNFVNQGGDGTIEGYVPLTADTKIYINGGLIEEIYKDSGNYQAMQFIRNAKINNCIFSIFYTKIQTIIGKTEFFSMYFKQLAVF